MQNVINKHYLQVLIYELYFGNFGNRLRPNRFCESVNVLADPGKAFWFNMVPEKITLQKSELSIIIAYGYL